MVIQYDKCDKWCLLFSKQKLSVKDRSQLEDIIIADISYTCGATVDEIVLPGTLQSVGIRSHDAVTQLKRFTILPTKMF